MTTNPKLIIQEAEQAALAAMQTAKTTPMIVTQHVDPLNDASPAKQQWYVPEGPCGFAWVIIRPARGAVVSELKKQGKGSRAYHGGLQVWMGQLTQTQSVEIKEAGAEAYANVLKNHGLDAYADSRLD